jgi:hypothetical protein
VLIFREIWFRARTICEIWVQRSFWRRISALLSLAT